MPVSKHDAVAEGGLICLKLLRIYEKLSPDDGVPFRVVAGVMSGRQRSPDDEGELRTRLFALQEAATALKAKRGILTAARHAIEATIALLNMSDPECDDFDSLLEAIRKCLSFSTESLSEMAR